MKKINATLSIVLLLCFATLGSCKKDLASKVDCEIKLFSGTSQDHQNYDIRFNAAGQMIILETAGEIYTYTYKKNEVIRKANGRKISTITLENGRAVRTIFSNAPYVQKHSYDQDGRLSQIVLEDSGNIGDTFTFNYIGGNLDQVNERVGKTTKANKYRFEYSDIKSDPVTRWVSYLNGGPVVNFIPLTLLGSVSVNLPSKMIYTEDEKLVFFLEYTYTISADNKVSAVDIKQTYDPKLNIPGSTKHVEITTTCH